MKKTFQTLLAAVAVTGLSAGAALAADNATTSMESGAPQATIGAQSDTSAQTGVGSSTSGAIQNNTSASAQVGATDAPIDQVQASLREEGYAVTVDGVWGPQSAEALRQFQTANNLDASGSLNAETLAALNVQSSTSAGQ